MKITHIEAAPFTIPCRNPLEFANGAATNANHVPVRVHTDEGVIGEAEAVPRAMTYGDSQVSTVQAIRAWFELALIGLDSFAVERAVKILSSVTGNHSANAAIDLALHDVMGKVAGIPCFQMLGGFVDRMEVSHILGFGNPTEVADEAASMAESFGIRAFKIKVGADPKLSGARGVCPFAEQRDRELSRP